MKLQDLLLTRTEINLAKGVLGREVQLGIRVFKTVRCCDEGIEDMVAQAQLDKIKKHIAGSREEAAIILCAHWYKNKVKWIKGRWKGGHICDSDKKRWRELADRIMKLLLGEEE